MIDCLRKIVQNEGKVATLHVNAYVSACTHTFTCVLGGGSVDVLARVLLYTLPHADRAYTLTPTLQSCWLILQSHAYWDILGHTGTNTANV